MTSVLNDKHFHDEEASYAFVEARVWPDGPICPHCGGVDRISKMKGKSTRIGTYKCYQCRKPFTVKIGTVFEASHIPLHIWLQAMFLMSSSKKGISSNQLHRTLGITLKSAWFLSHRIREAMRELHRGNTPLGGEGKTVEVDDTYIGGKEKNKHEWQREHAGRGGVGKEIVFTLVERDGKARSFHVANISADRLRPILMEQIEKSTSLYSDGAGGVEHRYAVHDTVNHSIGEYVRGLVHTNTVEGFFSIMKRGINGVYHHVSPKHLNRYLAEFDFRYSNRVALGIDDAVRTDQVVKGVSGKRLTYR